MGTSNMTRIATIAALALVSTLSTEAFTVSKIAQPQHLTSTFMADDKEDSVPIPGIERGVSVDQDGKSNVWALEPKMEIDTKSSEEKTTSLIIAGAGVAAFAVAAA